MDRQMDRDMERGASGGVLGRTSGSLLGIGGSACGTRQDVGVCAAIERDIRYQIGSGMYVLNCNLSVMSNCACITSVHFCFVCWCIIEA